MAAKIFKNGTILYEAGQPLDSLHIIASGQVRVSFPGGEFLLGKGDVIGLCDIYYGTHSCTYQTATDTQIGTYPFRQISDLENVLKTPEVSHFFVFSSAKQAALLFSTYEKARKTAVSFGSSVQEQYQKYKYLCNQYSAPIKALAELDAAEVFSPEEEPDFFLPSYYMELNGSAALKNSYTTSAALAEGFLMKTSKDIHTALEICEEIQDYQTQVGHFLLNEEYSDLFDLFVTLLIRLKKANKPVDDVAASLSSLLDQIEECRYISRDLYTQRAEDYKRKLILANASEDMVLDVSISDIANSLETILSYSELDKNICSEFRTLLAQYKKLLDKNSTDDNTRKLRLALTKAFYPIYIAAFKKSISDTAVPVPVQMFLHFGYMDEELSGTENAMYLYTLARQFKKVSSGSIYTFYQWLIAIYQGKKEPCRNEFDNDFPAYLRELKNTGKISEADEARMLMDKMERVYFELNNVFPLVNKITFGRITTFCPVFSEHNIFKSLENALVTEDSINETLQMIRNTDFSAFYRETAYSNEKCNINRENIQVEILPDIILMPGIGSRGVMWQEIEGRKRTTPARMMLPIFHMEDLSATLIRLTGEYRWEMCKRIQGARWNDVTERSLTSEFCDYAQFYRKNMDLSPEVKEKVKTALQKAKNSYKEMFVNDYITWILFEGNGAPRLNKVARGILFMHCPFSASIREKLSSNPLYKELLDAYNVRKGQKQHHLDAVMQRFRSYGVDIPPELQNQQTFLDM